MEQGHCICDCSACWLLRNPDRSALARTSRKSRCKRSARLAAVSAHGQVAYITARVFASSAGKGVADRTLFACRGTSRADQIRVGPARTTVEAGAGNDVIYARNYRIDTIYCGPGRDIVWANPGDAVRNCEIVHPR
jgi:hypothetical protein